MKLGINNSIWEIAGINLDKALDRINSFGFKYVDILAFGSGNPVSLSSRERRKIAKKFQELDLVSSGMVTLPPANIASGHSKEKEKSLFYLKSCAEFQAELGGKQILLGFGAGWKTLEISQEEAWVISLNFIREYCEYLFNLNILLTLELDPFVYNVVNDTVSMARMIEDVGQSNLFANIDIGHLAITRESPQTLEKLKDKIMHAHISDNNGKIHANWIIGTGVTKIADYLTKLMEMGIDGTCKNYEEIAVASLELGEVGQDIKNPDNYVRQSINYIKKNIPQLIP